MSIKISPQFQLIKYYVISLKQKHKHITGVTKRGPSRRYYYRIQRQGAQTPAVTKRRKKKIRKKENRLSIFFAMRFFGVCGWLGGLLLCASCQDLNRSGTSVMWELVVLMDEMNLVCLVCSKGYNPGGVCYVFVFLSERNYREVREKEGLFGSC